MAGDSFVSRWRGAPIGERQVLQGGILEIHRLAQNFLGLRWQPMIDATFYDVVQNQFESPETVAGVQYVVQLPGFRDA